MLSALRGSSSRLVSARAFSTSRPAANMAKLTLIGHLTKDPESRLTRNQKEFVVYTVATKNSSPPPDANGERRPATSTFHTIMSFRESANQYLTSLKKGSKVYVEAHYEIREPEPEADPTTPQGQRQIFLRHEAIRTLTHAQPREDSDVSAF